MTARQAVLASAVDSVHVSLSKASFILLTSSTNLFKYSYFNKIKQNSTSGAIAQEETIERR